MDIRNRLVPRHRKGEEHLCLRNAKSYWRCYLSSDCRSSLAMDYCCWRGMVCGHTPWIRTLRNAGGILSGREPQGSDTHEAMALSEMEGKIIHGKVVRTQLSGEQEECRDTRKMPLQGFFAQYSESYCFSPYIKSPASPSPGTIYLHSFSKGSRQQQ